MSHQLITTVTQVRHLASAHLCDFCKVGHPKCGAGRHSLKTSRYDLLRTRQNELSPNHVNMSVKTVATTTRPPVGIPALYLVSSRMKAIAPMPAKARKTKPVTSSQSWPRTRPQWAAAVRPAFITAANVRVRVACLAATRASSPSFRADEILAIAIDFINVLSTSSAVEYRDAGELHLKPRCTGLQMASTQRMPPTGRSKGGYVDQQLKQLMKELGEAINESLADSEQIAEVVSRIKDGGYDIFLVLEATIGVSKPGEKSADKTSLVTTLTSNPEFKINDQDLKFLKSLRIKIEDNEAA
jgi:hypothetical protein